MNKWICVIICFFVGFLIYSLIKNYCNCKVVEGNVNKNKWGNELIVLIEKSELNDHYNDIYNEIKTYIVNNYESKPYPNTRRYLSHMGVSDEHINQVFGGARCNPKVRPREMCPGNKACPNCGNESCLCPAGPGPSPPSPPGPPGPPSPPGPPGPPSPPGPPYCAPCTEPQCAAGKTAACGNQNFYGKKKNPQTNKPNCSNVCVSSDYCDATNCGKYKQSTETVCTKGEGAPGTFSCSFFTLDNCSTGWYSDGSLSVHKKKQGRLCNKRNSLGICKEHNPLEHCSCFQNPSFPWGKREDC